MRFIEGSVPTPFRLSPEEFGKLPHHLRVKDHQGKDTDVSGVPLVELLKRAGFEFGEKLRGERLRLYFLVTATDGCQAVFALPEIDPAFSDTTTVLFDVKDGRPPRKTGLWQVIVPKERRDGRWVRLVRTIGVRKALIAPRHPFFHPSLQGVHETRGPRGG